MLASRQSRLEAMIEPAVIQFGPGQARPAIGAGAEQVADADPGAVRAGKGEEVTSRPKPSLKPKLKPKPTSSSQNPSSSQNLDTSGAGQW